MAKIEIRSQGAAKVYEVLDDAVTVGKDAQNNIRLKDPDAAAFEAKLVRGAQGWHIEAAAEGRKLTVNGMTVRAADLETGDVVKLGNVELVLLSTDGEAAPVAAAAAPAPAPTPAPVPASPRATAPRLRSGGAGHAPQAQGTARRQAAKEREVEPGGARYARQIRDEKPMNSQRIGMLSAIGVLSLAAIFLVYKFVTGSSFNRSPADVIAEAASFLKDGNLESAEATLAIVERDLRGAITNQDAAAIAKLRGDMKSFADKKLDMPRLENAVDEFSGRVLNFREFYLKTEPWERPPARVYVGILEAWLRRHEAVCEKYPDYRDNQLKTVRELLPKARAVAKMNEPDTEADVRFRVKRAMELKRHNPWREIITACDTFLKNNPDNSYVRKMRAEVYEVGQKDMKKLIEEADAKLARGDDRVFGTFEFMIKEGAMPEWIPELEAKLRTLKK